VIIKRQILTEYSTHKPAYGDVELETIFDVDHDRYQVVSTGWSNQYGCLIHIDLKDDKIVIQYGTEVGIANELVARGVLKQDIVLAFHAPCGNLQSLRSASDQLACVMLLQP